MDNKHLSESESESRAILTNVYGMKRTLILTAMLALLCAGTASAQWSGSLKADGGWNFLKSNRENADFKLKYTADKYYLGTGLYIGHNFTTSTQTTSILDSKKEQDEYYKGEEKGMNPRKLDAGANLDFGYLFNAANALDLSINYGYNGKSDNSILETERYNHNRTSLNGTQIDTSYFRSHNINGRITYNHRFAGRPGANLNVTVSNKIRLNGDVNRRITSGSFYPQPKNYATYSNLNDFNTHSDVSYDDAFHFSKSILKLKTGLEHYSNQDIDLYAAETFVNGQWRDSTEYRQSYFYNSQTFEPYANLTYTIGKFDFFIRERMQVYWHALMDKLDERKTPDQQEYLFKKYEFENLLSAGISYNINERHSMMVDYNRSISRPDYKKLCPTMMIGGSEGEYFIGNIDLLPETTDKVHFGYSYTKGIFVTKLDFNYRNKRNTAEKVIDLEKSKDIKNPMVKTLYTWINNKKEDSFGVKLDFKMNLDIIKADIWAGFNYDIYGNNKQTNKEDFNYELGTTIDVNLTKTSKLSSSLIYISAKQSAYNYKGEDVIANLRFSKIIIKGLDLYVEINDIVDKETYEETWNADMNYLKVSSTKPLNRAIMLGINYVF